MLAVREVWSASPTALWTAACLAYLMPACYRHGGDLCHVQQTDAMANGSSLPCRLMRGVFSQSLESAAVCDDRVRSRKPEPLPRGCSPPCRLVRVLAVGRQPGAGQRHAHRRATRGGAGRGRQRRLGHAGGAQVWRSAQGVAGGAVWADAAPERGGCGAQLPDRVRAPAHRVLPLQAHLVDGGAGACPASAPKGRAHGWPKCLARSLRRR